MTACCVLAASVQYLTQAASVQYLTQAADYTLYTITTTEASLLQSRFNNFFVWQFMSFFVSFSLLFFLYLLLATSSLCLGEAEK